jgi:hypothetical protein
MADPKIVILVFVSGKIVMTGAKVCAQSMILCFLTLSRIGASFMMLWIKFIPCFFNIRKEPYVGIDPHIIMYTRL